MARNIICEVEAPEGLTFQGHKIISLKIANDGDDDGNYILAMEYDKSIFAEEFDEPFDAALAEEFVDPWLIRGRDF